jgi:hypothetical protein
MSVSKQKAKKSKKEPKVATTFKTTDRQPRLELNPDSNRNKKPSWHVGLIDFNCKWSFGKLENINSLYAIIDKLKSFETMTWQEIFDASGGRAHGNNNHDVPVNDLDVAARKRLKDLQLDDLSSLFSLRLTGTQRIWGILDGNVLKILWLDNNHEVCPMKNK